MKPSPLLEQPVLLTAQMSLHPQPFALDEQLCVLYFVTENNASVSILISSGPTNQFHQHELVIVVQSAYRETAL